MAQANTVRRLTVTAQQNGVREVARDVAALGDSVQAAATKTASGQVAFDRSASMMAASGKKVAAGVQAIETPLEALKRTQSETTRLTLSQARSFDNLAKSLDPAYRNAVRFEAIQTRVNAGLASGAYSSERAATLIGLAGTKYKQFGAQAGVANQNVKLATHELGNLTRQGGDVFTMLSLGASPMTVFLTQADQIRDAISSGQGGLAGGFIRLKNSAAAGLASLAGFATTLPGIAIGLTGAAAAALYFATRTTDEIKPLNDALEAHKKAIGDVAEAYGVAQGKAEDYARTSAGVASVLARQSAAELKLSARNALSDAFAPGLTNYKFLTPAVGNEGPLGKVGVADEYKAFAGPLLKLNEEMKAGTGNAIDFVEAVAGIANQKPTDAALQKHASELIELAKAAAEAQRQLKQVIDPLESLRKIASQSLQANRAELKGMVPDFTTPADRAFSLYQQQVNSATTAGSPRAVEGIRTEATRDYGRALDEITRKEDLRRAGIKLDIASVGELTMTQQAQIAAQRAATPAYGKTRKANVLRAAAYFEKEPSK